MSLQKTVVFVSAPLVQRYQRLARQYGVSRSYVLRMAIETSYDAVRQMLVSRAAQAAAPTDALGGGTLAAVTASMRNAATVALRAQPTADETLLRAIVVEEGAKHPGVNVPDEVVDGIVQEFSDPDEGLHRLPGDVPPR